MKLKKILIVVLLLLVLFSNCSIFATSSGDFYYKGSFQTDTSGVKAATPTYDASSSSGIVNEMISVMQMCMLVIVVIMVLFIFLYFYLRRGSEKKPVEKPRENMDEKDDEVIRKG